MLKGRYYLGNKSKVLRRKNMKVNIHTYSFGNNMPVYKGYIEMDNFDADTLYISR